MKEPNQDSKLAASGRLPGIQGVDYKRAAIEYTGKLDARGFHYLLTKPFHNLARKIPRFRGNGMDLETHRHFCDFANMAVALDLPPGARILDAGCGSGWLSEYFARLGYEVTGIDLNPELIRLSQERLSNLAYPVDDETPLRSRFQAHDIELAPLDETFDAIICYDAMHHFLDEYAVVRNFAAMLPVGGLLFILEGRRPPPASTGETELIAAMNEHRVLESPFEPAYLRQLLDEVGFAVIGDYVSVNDFIDRDSLDSEKRVYVETLEVNYLLCKKVEGEGGASRIPTSHDPGLLRVRYDLRETWRECFAPGETIVLPLSLENTGDTLWLGGRHQRRSGIVTLGIKIIDQAGVVVDEFHGEPPLPRCIAPREKADVVVEHACPSLAGSYTLKIDLVDQNICWFEERGAEPLSLPLQVR
jgi:SAM-dependent methyltransferase